MRGTRAVLPAVMTSILALSGCAGGGSSTSPVPIANTPAPIAPAGITVAFSTPPTAVAGFAEVFALTVTVRDANGNVISGAFAVPVTLTDSDTSGATKLSTTTLTAGNQSVSLSYSGARMTGSVTISATAANVPASNVTPATFSLSSSSPYVPGDSFAYRDDTFITYEAPGSASSWSYTNSLTVAVETPPATFNGRSGLTDVAATFSDLTDGITENTDDYYAYTSGNPVTLALYGEKDVVTFTAPSEAGNATILQTYAAPRIVDRLPNVAGDAWNPAQAYTEIDNEAYPASNLTYTEKLNVAADGSYQDGSSPYAIGVSRTYVQTIASPDASYTQTTVAGDSSGTQVTYTIRAQAPYAGNINRDIQCTSAIELPDIPVLPVAVSDFPTPMPGQTPRPDCTNSTGQTVLSTDLTSVGPSWYPPNYLPLDQEAYSVVSTSATAPSNCVLPASMTSGTTQIRYTQQLLDPASQIKTTTIDGYFLPDDGMVCSVQRIKQTLYGPDSSDGQAIRTLTQTDIYTLLPPSVGTTPAARHLQRKPAPPGFFLNGVHAAQRARFERSLRRKQRYFGEPM